jgi:hypothetical protein
MLKTRKLGFSVALLILAGLPSGSQASTLFNFNYSLPAAPDIGVTDTITASGILTTNFDPIAGNYLITGITGTRFFDGIPTQITGLLPVGTFGSDNILYYPNHPLLDFFGFAFTIDKPALSNDGLGNVLIFFDSFGPAIEPNAPDFYTEVFSAYGTFDVTQATPTPEPSTGMLLIGGLLTFAGVIGRRRAS